MDTQSKVLSVPQDIASQIEVLSDIAKISGSRVRVEEILALTSLDFTERELELAWSATPNLNARFQLRSGIVLELSEAEVDDLAAGDVQRRLRAKGHLRHASDFAAFARLYPALLVAVSGSTSYMSVGECDDIDLFCVTKRDTLWLFLTRALLMARVFKLLRRSHRKICLSYVADQTYAEHQFSGAKDALFARDALNAFVIRGISYYRSLLLRAPWMSSYFPGLYHSKAQEVRPGGVVLRGRKIIRRIANLFLFALVGNYIRTKSFVFNRRLERQGKRQAVFTADLSEDHCLFESNRYAELRAAYAQILARPKR